MVAARDRKPRLGVMTTRDVAEHFGVTPGQVLRQIRLGRLKSRKLGWIHVIRRDDLPDQWPPEDEN